MSLPITNYIHLYIHLCNILVKNTMSSEGISLQVTIWLSPENVPKFFEALLPVYEKVIAEPECTFFEYYEDPAEPGKISWVENWWAVNLNLSTSVVEVAHRSKFRSKSAEWLLQVHYSNHFILLLRGVMANSECNRIKYQRNITRNISPSPSRCFWNHENLKSWSV